MKKQTSIFLFLLTLLFSTYGQSLDQRLKQNLDSICKTSGYPGVVFAYVSADGKSHPIVSGFADKEAEVKMTPEHKLHSGSTGKVVVSAVAMQLVQEGELQLDKRLRDYLGENEWFDRLPNADSITVRHLMQHSSGIERYEFKEAFLTDLTRDPDRVWKAAELVAYVLDDQPPFAAGQGFTYADTNYILLGMIIEKITRDTFYHQAKIRILDPLGLASYTPTYTRKIPMMAQGYYDPSSEYALGFKSPFLKDGVAQNNMQFEWTGGGYAYQTQEYAQLLKKIYEGEVFDLDKVGEDFFRFIESPEIGGQYGLGVQQMTLPEIGKLWGHSGFFPGYYSIGLYDPERKMSYAMQINSTDMPHLQCFFRDYMTMIKKVIK